MFASIDAQLRRVVSDFAYIGSQLKALSEWHEKVNICA
jgi:hypothetical protein